MTDGRLPPTLYVQIDGGPENANKLVLAVLSFLVAKRVGGLEQIVLTRLPVGHTHEDIDGIFGRISQYIIDRHVLTSHTYKKAIEAALGKASHVIDLYVVPNYSAFFKDCVDRNFGSSFKNEKAKLQFTLQAVPVDPIRYPVGVKMTCRRYVQEFYPEVFVDEQAPLGVSVKIIRSRDFPAPEEAPLNVLLSMPCSGERDKTRCVYPRISPTRTQLS